MSLNHRLEGSEAAVDVLQSLGAATAAAAVAALREAPPPCAHLRPRGPPPPLLEGDFLAMLTDMLDRAGQLCDVMLKHMPYVLPQLRDRS